MCLLSHLRWEKDNKHKKWGILVYKVKKFWNIAPCYLNHGTWRRSKAGLEYVKNLLYDLAHVSEQQCVRVISRHRSQTNLEYIKSVSHLVMMLAKPRPKLCSVYILERCAMRGHARKHYLNKESFRRSDDDQQIFLTPKSENKGIHFYNSGWSK